VQRLGRFAEVVSHSVGPFVVDGTPVDHRAVAGEKQHRVADLACTGVVPVQRMRLAGLAQQVLDERPRAGIHVLRRRGVLRKLVFVG